jgi:hypothetical protein
MLTLFPPKEGVGMPVLSVVVVFVRASRRVPFSRVADEAN